MFKLISHIITRHYLHEDHDSINIVHFFLHDKIRNTILHKVRPTFICSIWLGLTIIAWAVQSMYHRCITNVPSLQQLLVLPPAVLAPVPLHVIVAVLGDHQGALLVTVPHHAPKQCKDVLLIVSYRDLHYLRLSIKFHNIWRRPSPRHSLYQFSILINRFFLKLLKALFKCFQQGDGSCRIGVLSEYYEMTALVILFLPELVCVVAHGLVVRLGQELVVQHAVREHEPGWGWTVNIFPPQQIFSARCVTCRAPAPRV